MNAFTKARILLGAGVLAVVLGLFLPLTPASAAVFAMGSGNHSDDWSPGNPKMPNLYWGYQSPTDIVQVWQGILHAHGYFDGYRTNWGYTTTYNGVSEIDGSFGKKTYYATKQWQWDRGFRGGDVDGEVGPKTWGAANRLVKWRYPSQPNPDYIYLMYDGTKRDFYFNRSGHVDGTGAYFIPLSDGTSRLFNFDRGTWPVTLPTYLFG